jgi:hypothetical protein
LSWQPPRSVQAAFPSPARRRKLYEATGGKPQRWESLGNLGAVKADAVGIAYAIERNGRRRVK